MLRYYTNVRAYAKTLRKVFSLDYPILGDFSRVQQTVFQGMQQLLQ